MSARPPLTTFLRTVRDQAAASVPDGLAERASATRDAAVRTAQDARDRLTPHASAAVRAAREATSEAVSALADGAAEAAVVARGLRDSVTTRLEARAGEDGESDDQEGVASAESESTLGTDPEARRSREAVTELPCLGIDLGTTFSAVAILGEDGEPVVIDSSVGDSTTPSVVWFDGRQAYVGRKANLRKDSSQRHNVVEFVKRAMGRPATLPPGADVDPTRPPAPYPVAGFNYGPEGISALILRRLKGDAVRHFVRRGLLPRNAKEEDLTLDAVITVPAYFGDIERQQTMLAGYAAGLNVRAVINEPTAAALTFGASRSEPKRLLVFDLGGGTFDVTVLETAGDGSATVIASKGDRQLGGKDVDTKIEEYLLDVFDQQFGADFPEEQLFDLQDAALRAKMELSEADEAFVSIPTDLGDLDVTLYRAREDAGEGMADFMMEEDGEEDFYLEDRILDLLMRCRLFAEQALDAAADHPSRDGKDLDWADIDEIVLAGGSCRIPAVRRLLGEWSGRPVLSAEQFDLDTAVAIGAALYGAHMERVSDVLSHSVGIEVVEGGRHIVDYLLTSGTPLPIGASRSFPAPPNAHLIVREGDTDVVLADETRERGRLLLQNEAAGDAFVTLRADRDGVLHATVSLDGTPRDVPIRNDQFDFDDRAVELRDRVLGVRLNT